MRPEHRRQPRYRPGAVGGHQKKWRAPEGGRSTLPGCGQERRPQGPAAGSKERRERRRRVKTSRYWHIPFSKQPQANGPGRTVHIKDRPDQEDKEILIIT
jgi:hypothetical protein